MAFPWLFESNFEAGTNAEWSAETDTGSQLDFPHVSQLLYGKDAIGNMAPYRGAYCMRCTLGANSTDAFLRTTAIDIADSGTAWFRWKMFFGKDFAATAADVVSIFKLRQAGGGTVEYTVGISMDGSGGLVLGGSDGTAAATFGSTNITLGVWHDIEVKATVSTGGAGAIVTYLDGVQQSSETSKTQAAATGDADLGFSDRLATTTGTVLFDQFIQDDARIYPIVDRFPRQLVVTKSGHLFVGPGEIESIQLITAGTDNFATLYDTNRANTNDAFKVGSILTSATTTTVVENMNDIEVRRGAYLVLAGTNPKALVTLGDWVPAYGSVGAVRTVAGRLKLNPYEVL